MEGTGSRRPYPDEVGSQVRVRVGKPFLSVLGSYSSPRKEVSAEEVQNPNGPLVTVRFVAFSFP